MTVLTGRQRSFRRLLATATDQRLSRSGRRKLSDLSSLAHDQHRMFADALLGHQISGRKTSFLWEKYAKFVGRTNLWEINPKFVGKKYLSDFYPNFVGQKNLWGNNLKFVGENFCGNNTPNLWDQKICGKLTPNLWEFYHGRGVASAARQKGAFSKYLGSLKIWD